MYISVCRSRIRSQKVLTLGDKLKNLLWMPILNAKLCHFGRKGKWSARAVNVCKFGYFLYSHFHTLFRRFFMQNSSLVLNVSTSWFQIRNLRIEIPIWWKKSVKSEEANTSEIFLVNTITKNDYFPLINLFWVHSRAMQRHSSQWNGRIDCCSTTTCLGSRQSMYRNSRRYSSVWIFS